MGRGCWRSVFGVGVVVFSQAQTRRRSSHVIRDDDACACCLQYSTDNSPDALYSTTCNIHCPFTYTRWISCARTYELDVHIHVFTLRGMAVGNTRLHHLTSSSSTSLIQSRRQGEAVALVCRYRETWHNNNPYPYSTPSYPASPPVCHINSPIHRPSHRCALLRRL
jgi:hypothetical protein